MSMKLKIAQNVGINKSKSYILPLFSGYIDIRFIDFIINTYIFTAEDSSLKCLHILYDIKLKENPYYEEYVDELSTNLCLKDMKVTSKGVLLSLLIPAEHYDDYNYFLVGKYSNYQDNSKKKVLYFLHSTYPEFYDTIKKVEAILYKKIELRKSLEDRLGISLPKDSELSSVIDVEEETFYE